MLDLKGHRPYAMFFLFFFPSFLSSYHNAFIICGDSDIVAFLLLHVFWPLENLIIKMEPYIFLSLISALYLITWVCVLM